MVLFNFILIVSVIFKRYLAVDALVAESLVSENEAAEGQFKYQAIIMGKENGSEVSAAVGSAGIISPIHLLGAAQTFIDEKGDLRNLTFSAVVDEINAKSEILILRKIVRFFLPESGGFQVNDISISELSTALDLDNNPRLSQLDIAERYPGFMTPPGVVAGYGFNEVELEELEEEIGVRIKNGSTDGKLRYETVQITDRYCVPSALRNKLNYFCGEMLTSAKRRGLCILDQGSPLVITQSNRDIVVGVASTHNQYCDDTCLGGLYSNVGENYWFIYGVLRNELTYKTLVYMNRPHTINNQITGGENSSELELLPWRTSIVGHYDQLVLIQHSPTASLHNHLKNVNASTDEILAYIDQHMTIFNGQRWIIRSIRPINTTTGEYFKYCQTLTGVIPTYDHQSMSGDLIIQLTRIWPILSPHEVEENLWRDEYNIYGSCVSAFNQIYFHNAVDLWETYNIGDIFHQLEIKPGKRYAFNHIVSSLNKTLGNPISIKCVSEKTPQDQYLLEVKLCFTPTLHLVACYNDTLDCDADKDVMYPGVSTTE